MERSSTKNSSDFTRKYHHQLKSLTKEKCSRLFLRSFSVDEEKIYDIETWMESKRMKKTSFERILILHSISILCLK
jgi:hypothetical protein